MRKYFVAFLCMLICGLALAQAPQKMSYQAVIRDSRGNLVANREISLRISIMKQVAIGNSDDVTTNTNRRSGSALLSGVSSSNQQVAVYKETHTATTNANGLVTVEIGEGNTSNDFSAINWAEGKYYLKTEVDINGGSSFTYLGTSQMVSVPYAIYSQTAGSVIVETDPQFNAWDKDYNDLTNKPTIPTVPTVVSAFENDANYITSADVPAQVNADWNATEGNAQILNKPELFSGNYEDLTNKPTIPTVPTVVSAFENDANYITSEDVPAQVNADWNATEGNAQILNKPELFSGNYNDLTNKPEIPTVPTVVSAFENDANYITLADVPAQVNADWNATEGNAQILNKPELFSGNYEDLTNKPTIPTSTSQLTNDANYITSADVPAQVNADWNATEGNAQILNKPELFSGNYEDLTNKPTIPTVPTVVSAFENDANYITSADVPAQVNADWNATSGAGQILNKPELFSGNYNDLTNKPTIPTVPTNVSAFTNDANYITSADVPAQVNADWNATSGAGQILNKPELFSGDYNDLTNKPTIPAVPTNVSAFTNDANYITSADVPAQVNADWNATEGNAQILNKPEMFSGNYNDLTNKPEIPTVPTVVSAFENDANYITSADVPAQVNADWNATSGAGQILNKPELFSGNYNDLTNRPEIPTVPTNVSAFTNDANYITSADVPAQVNADWNATSGAGQILNKPEIPIVPTNVSAFTNDANYITSADVPAQVNADWNATSGAGQILNKPELFSGNYNDLTNKPTIPAVPTNVSAFTNDANYITSADVPAQVNADWNATSGAGQILNKPEIPTVPTNVSAFTNDANYITSADVPAQVNADWNATSGAGQILNKPELFSGNYNDLTNRPEIPTVPTNVSAFTNDANYITSADVPAQVNADWNATSGAGQILNKPELFDGNYNNLTNTPDLSGYITTESQTLADAAALGNSMGNRQIKNVADPTDNQDAVTKKYLEDIIAELRAEIAEMQATIDVLSAAQGGSNVTYTITFNANGGTGTMQPQTFTAETAQAITTNTFTKENYNFAGWNTAANGSGTAYTDGQSITISENMTLYAQWEVATSGTLGGHYWIDLGLPSGTLWANCNVGANNPEDFGNYYMWGETSPYTGGSSTYTSNPTVLPSSADAAAVNWGEEWRMPTKAEMQELIDNCTIVSSTQGNVSGRRITGPNGNSIFIPGTGYKYGTFSQGGTYAYYMSSSRASTGSTPSTIWILIVDSNGARMNSSTRAGYSVRPVCPATAITGSTNQSQQTPFGSFTDTRDGNEYATVKIGEQTWMAENLRYVGNVSMGSMTSSAVAYRYYPSNNASNVSTYGYLYNWTAAMNGSSSSSANPSGVQGICPNGWHLPSSDEWTQLRDALDNTDVGSKLAGSAGLWASGALYENSSFGTSGFNALPSGAYMTNKYPYFGEATYFWSATENDSDNGLGRSLRYNSTGCSVLMGGKQQGYSIRCVRND